MKKLIAILLLFPLQSVAATTYYVDAGKGSDSNSGKSLSSPKKTIQAAINAAADGDTLLVAAGIYTPIVTGNKAITINGVAPRPRLRLG